MRGKNYLALISPLKEFIDTAAHGVLENTDDLFEIDMLVVISFYTEESTAALVVGCHRDFVEECVNGSLFNIEALQDPHGSFFHDILGARACRHPGNFGPDTFAHDRFAECTPGNCPGMHFYYFVADGMADRCLALDHELAAHEHFCAVGILMAIQEFSRNNTAKLLDLVDIAVNSLLEDFIDHFKVTGKVCTFETSGKIHIYIKIGDENYRPFLVTVNLHEFFYIFYTDPGEVYPDIRRCRLDVRKFFTE